MAWEYTLGELTKVVHGKLNGNKHAVFSGVSTDTRTIKPGNIFFALPGNKVDGHQFVQEAINKGAIAVIVSKETNESSIYVPNTLYALQQFARWHRTNLKANIFAITGSCGKTTTKELVYSVLNKKYKVVASKGNYNNELGCPLSLLQMDEETEWGIIEMGAGKPGDIAELCAIAYPEESGITTIAPAHLERLGSIDGVAKEKANIAKCLPPWGSFYVNKDDPYCVSIANRILVPKIYFGQNGDISIKSIQRVSDSKLKVEVEPVGVFNLPLCSRAYLSNFLFAIAVSFKHQIPADEKSLCDAYERAGRIRIYKIGELFIIDDSYNANPASMNSALEYLSLIAPQGYRCAVLGDMLELGEASGQYHFSLGKEIANYGVDNLFLYGNYANEIAKGAKLGGVPKIYIGSTHEDIADKLLNIIQPQSFVLVKGSRGMTMEKVIETLKRKIGLINE
ncbi:MAG TPA: UDP-N-acetylmuramoyl-tripeptide--D-alanyl-D-alanine ligase [Candidatus Hydrogenedens sp.]|nr:UDP-N-acetylmuramoyl-tripeptide--D-alanyl-D-alanine ligase [Candidatus Hydrogenedens sp.]HOK08793.1 UDP-N-acetylmuramoyl-tripeptide--D-alanyl-D-alanine ligase [Candidatus Hydrogenedens sp.]HPP58482.1 UDP-N-acetylmuramoyl-tripeptide--D-alanyl-D-alanine ligase [Candidatus Hydrogenedens sp.]